MNEISQLFDININYETLETDADEFRYQYLLIGTKTNNRMQHIIRMLVLSISCEIHRSK